MHYASLLMDVQGERGEGATIPLNDLHLYVLNIDMFMPNIHTNVACIYMGRWVECTGAVQCTNLMPLNNCKKNVWNMFKFTKDDETYLLRSQIWICLN